MGTSKTSSKVAGKARRAVRETLEAERDRLIRRLEQAGEDTDLNTWSDSTPDVNDLSTAATEREQASALGDAARRKLDQTRDALARLDDGTYGTCERCGDKIADARLEALPTAATCTACAW